MSSLLAARMVALLLVSVVTIAGVSSAKDSDHLIGPTGMFGATGKKDIKVTKVDKGSPADGKVKAGDVIVGANGRQFSKDPRREMVDAINQAESTAAKGVLPLMLKGGKTVELQLKVYGSFSETAPYDCAKTNALVTAIADKLIATPKTLDSDKLAIGWLGLMATGEEKYMAVVKSRLPQQDWAKPNRDELMAIVNGAASGYVAWYWGYELIALSEYYLLTGDKSVMPGIEAYAIALSKGQDVAGTWGHRMTSPGRDGRLPGYSHINQPSLACFIGLTLAQACGVNDPVLQQAIEKCQGFFNTFTNRGTIPYGVHNPNSRDFNNNGMSGSCAIAMSLAGDKKAAKFFSRQVATDYDRLETGHASYFFNVLWSPLGANLAGPEVTKEYNKRSRWLYTLYRSWDDRFTHDGSGHKALAPEGALLLNYCMPRQQLFITGKKADESIWAKGPEALGVIGLSAIDYSKLSIDELLNMFGHDAPQVRRRAVWALREREGDFLGEVEKMVTAGNDDEQISAIGFFGYQCPPEWALPRLELLGKVLRDPKEDPEVRASAAASITCMKPQGQAYYQDILRLLVENKSGDQYGLMDEGIGDALMALSENPYADGLVKDKDLFYQAVIKLSHNPRQGGRGTAMKLLMHMPASDFPLVADDVKRVALNRDPASHSYHNPGSTLLPACQLLAKLGIKEGPEWALQTMHTRDGKGSFKARAVVGVLNAYGADAKDAVEQVKANPEMLKTLSGGRWGKAWNETIKAIDAGKGVGPMISFEDAKKGKVAK